MNGSLIFLVNGTSARGLDVSAFYAEKFKKTGLTVYAAYNHGSPYDPADIDLTAIPKYNRFTLNPKLFLYLNDKTDLNIGINSTIENRIGGDLHYIEGDGDAQHTYFEQNKTSRHSSQATLNTRLNDKETLQFKNSISYFNRTINLPDYTFSGRSAFHLQRSNYTYKSAKTDWVAGINYLGDDFSEHKTSSFALRSYNYKTIGAFVQNTWDISDKFILETGLRGDHHNKYGFFFLPTHLGFVEDKSAGFYPPWRRPGL
jgi:outer membrane receptor for ferrienterochelin and colicins